MLNLPKDIDNSLTDFLKVNAVIDEQQCENARSEINGSGASVIGHLISNNTVTEDQIADSFATCYGLKKVEIEKNMLKNRPLKDVVNDSFILKNRIVPFRVDDNTVHVIIADPSALNNVNNVKMITGKSVETLVSKITSFEQFLSDLTDNPTPAAEAVPDTPREPAEIKAIKTEENVKQVQIRKTDLIPDASAPSDAQTGSDVINYVDFLLDKSISNGASDIHLEIFRDSARVRIRRDGVLQEIEESNDFLVKNYSAVTTRIKILSNLDISERRLPQDGGMVFEMDGKTVDIRVSILPTAHGERVVMRILDPEAANFTLDEIGLSDEVLKKVRKAVHAPQGMVLVTGPTGSGKSTTLYAVLKELNDDGVNILTAEDPVEFDLPGVGQVKVKDNIGLTFASALKSFLRQDPEVIMVGEIRDKDTSDISIKAALTGHLVLSTLHTNDAPSTITRMVNMGIPPYLINSALTLVIAQRLARVNCENCKEEDKSVTKEALIAVGFDEKEAGNVKVLKGKGCDSCMNSGIKGRRGVYEVLPITDSVKEAVNKGESDIAIKEIAKKEGFESMQHVGRNLLKEGIISLEEYQRILILD